MSCSGRYSSPNSSATTTAAASTAQTPSSVALLAGGAPALPLVFPPLGVAVVREEVGIPLSKHWLPKDTQHNPLDEAHSLLRQLERLSPVYSEYETALATYEAKSTAPGSRRKSTNMSTTKAIGLSKVLVTKTFHSLRTVAELLWELWIDRSTRRRTWW